MIFSLLNIRKKTAALISGIAIGVACLWGLSMWDMDHIRAVAEGGGLCGLANLRTLCIFCHHKETEKLNKRIQQKTKASKKRRKRRRRRPRRAKVAKSVVQG